MASMLFPIHDREGRRGYIDADGNVVVPLIYDADGIMGYFWTDRARIFDCDKKRYGYLDLDGNPVIPPQYRQCEEFSGDRAWVMNDDGRWGVTDKMGRPITECIYRKHSRYRFQEGRWLCSPQHPETSKHGLMDQEGNMVLPFSYEHGLLFSEGLVAVKMGENTGFIDIQGHVVIEPVFWRDQNFQEGLAGVALGERLAPTNPTRPQIRFGKAGFEVTDVKTPRPRFIDKTGGTVFEHDFVGVNPFQHGLTVATVPRHERQGFIDRTGAFVIEPRFKEVRNFGFLSSGVAVVMEKRRVFLIDRNGDRVGNQAFTQMYHVNSCDDTLFCVFDGGKWGFVNCQGEFEIPPRFTAGTRFHHGLAEVGEEINGRLRTGYVNRAGEYVFKQDW
jgi:hypothetical protein